MDPTQEEWEAAVKTFQDMAGIQKTGVVDSETLDGMSQPRCGNNDVNRHGNRGKRFCMLID